jgi:hypothetical protein
MDSFLGLLGLVVYAASVISLASGVTWLVVKLFPAKEKKPKPAEEGT